MRPLSNLQLGSRRARFGLCDIRSPTRRLCHPISPIDNPPSTEELPAQSGPYRALGNHGASQRFSDTVGGRVTSYRWSSPTSP